MVRNNSLGSLVWRFLTRRDNGASGVEFALLLPLLVTVLFAIIKFGITLGNSIQLTDGVRVATRVLASSRGSSTPYSSMETALANGAPGLTLITSATYQTATVAGTTCSSDASCITAFASATPGTSTVVLTQKYDCDLNVFFINFAPTCKLSASAQELVE